MSECLKLLKELVAIPSVNPVYGGPGEPHVESFVSDFLRSHGIEFRVQEVLPGRNNLMARIGPDDRPAVLVDVLHGAVTCFHPCQQPLLRYVEGTTYTCCSKSALSLVS